MSDTPAFPRAPRDEEEREAVTNFDSPWCDDAIPDAYCTRKPGHDGDHAGSDGDGIVLARWPASPAPVEAPRTSKLPTKDQERAGLKALSELRRGMEPGEPGRLADRVSAVEEPADDTLPASDSDPDMPGIRRCDRCKKPIIMGVLHTGSGYAGGYHHGLPCEGYGDDGHRTPVEAPRTEAPKPAPSEPAREVAEVLRDLRYLATDDDLGPVDRSRAGGGIALVERLVGENHYVVGSLSVEVEKREGMERDLEANEARWGESIAAVRAERDAARSGCRKECEDAIRRAYARAEKAATSMTGQGVYLSLETLLALLPAVEAPRTEGVEAQRQESAEDHYSTVVRVIACLAGECAEHGSDQQPRALAAIDALNEMRAELSRLRADLAAAERDKARLVEERDEARADALVEIRSILDGDCEVEKVPDLVKAVAEDLQAALTAKAEAERQRDNLRASHEFPRVQDVAEIDSLRARLATAHAALATAIESAATTCESTEVVERTGFHQSDDAEATLRNAAAAIRGLLPAATANTKGA